MLVTAVVKVDISAARAAIFEAPGTVAGMLKDPPSAVVVKAIANVDLIIQAWISDAQQPSGPWIERGEQGSGDG